MMYTKDREENVKGYVWTEVERKLYLWSKENPLIELIRNGRGYSPLCPSVAGKIL